MAPGFHLRHLGGRTLQHRFQPAVGQVAGPAADPVQVGLAPQALPEADTLHPAVQPEVMATHARAALPITSHGPNVTVPLAVAGAGARREPG